MDAEFYQKYAFIDYHLVALLNEWKRVKPHFEAKLSNVSLTVKPFILQSLMQFKQRIDKARLRLYDVIKYVSIYSRCSQLWTLRLKLDDTPKTGLSDRYVAALDIMADIDVMRESMRCFLNCETYFARNILCLNLNSTDQWDRAVQIVAGDYTWLGLRGPYTWKHAIYFMNISKKLRYVSLDSEMLLEVDDFDNFFEAIVQWLREQKYATAIYIECPTLDLTFEARIREYVESRTNFDVILPFNWVVICKEPKI